MILRTIENADLPLALPPGYGKNMNKTGYAEQSGQRRKEKGTF